MRTHLRKPEISDRGNILTFEKGLSSDLRNELKVCEQSRRLEAEQMTAIGTTACSIFHDMRHSLSVIYANAEFLEGRDRCASERVDLLLEIQEAVVRIADRIDSLLKFGTDGKNNPPIPQCVSLILEKAIAAVKLHPDGRNVSISVGKVSPVEADVDVRNLESAICNLLLNACQAATCSSHVPEVKVHLMEVDERICCLRSFPTLESSTRRIPIPFCLRL